MEVLPSRWTSRRLPSRLKRLAEIGFSPSDSAKLQVRKTVLVLSSTLMASLACLWVGTYAALGLRVSAAIPFAYQFASAASIYTFARTCRYLLFRRSQLWMSLVFPFVLQVSLGGFENSSAVCLWAFTAPLGALLSVGTRQAVPWFVTSPARPHRGDRRDGPDSFAGVGDHLGVARLLQGERVLDLGGDSGMDVFAAATQVGPRAVTGVDITPERLAKAERLRRGQHARFLRARIEELPFDDGSVDAVIPNGVVNLSADKRRVFAEAARVLRPGGRLALADIVTEREIATPTARQAELWAACIAGASQTDRYLENIGAAGLQLQAVQTNPAYRFASERAQRTSREYAAHSVSLLALKPASGSRPTNPTTTEEISK